MRFLGILGLGRVLARHRRQIGLAERLEDRVAGGGDGFAGHLNAVGPHIGDEADGLAADLDAFIEALGDLHGSRRGEAELARGLLLQRRGAEGRVGMALDRLALDGIDRERRALECRFDGARRGFVLDVELAEPLAVDGIEAGRELVAARA